MGTPYMIASSGLLILESALQIYVTISHSKFSDSLFIALLALVMGPIIVINFISAIQVTRTQDFSDKKFGRAVCIGFHSFQLGMIWRSLKLVILYDSRDWSEFLALRILHAGFQSLPYGIVLVVSLLIYNSTDALRIVSAVVSLASAAVALSSYRLGDTLYESEEFETRKMKIKRNFGVILLVISKLFLLFCRCACICLFSVVHPVWIGLILGTHYILQLLFGIINKMCRHKLSILAFLKLLYMSYFNVFDLTGRGYSGIKCSYVLYYTAVLVENIVMSAFWMLTADQGERYKLVTVFLVLMSFIVGMIVKFTSCGCIFNIDESLLDDAFNNPVVKVNVDNEMTVPKLDATPNGVIQESSPAPPDQTVSFPRAISRGKSPSNTKRSISNKDSRSTKSSKPPSKASYENSAFVSSQGSINNTLDKPQDTKSVKTTSDNSGNSQKKLEENVKGLKMDSIGDLASSYSRNTNTLNVSNKPRYFNSFDDPFRERNRIQVNLTSSRNRQQHTHHNRSQSHALRTIYGTHHRSSLDSSELYPSESSVTSSSISYMNTDGRLWNKRTDIRIKPYSADYDGYTTDVSNSEMVSYTYSMEDSSSWTESSESVSAITWPPSHTTNLLKMYNISDSVSSKDNVMHWLDSVDPDIDTTHDLSFPTVNDLSMMADDASEASMSGMKRFEVKKKKDKIRLKKILPKTKEVFLKFRSLNYKSKDKELNDRPYPLNRKKQTQGAQDTRPQRNPLPNKPGMTQSSVQFRGNVMQESIV